MRKFIVTKQVVYTQEYLVTATNQEEAASKLEQNDYQSNGDDIEKSGLRSFSEITITKTRRYLKRLELK